MPEFKNQFGSKGEPGYAEQNKAARAKKTVDGATVSVSQLATTPADIRSIDPIQVASPAVLLRGKNYRMISVTDVNYRQSNEIAPVAAATDIFLPAKTSIVISTDLWEKVAWVGAGPVQFLELAE